MEFARRLQLVISTLLCVPACGFPVSDSSFEVGEMPADPEQMDRVIAAFAGSGESCGECLRTACRKFSESCARSKPCAQYAECMLDERSPAAATHCMSAVRPSLDEVSRFADLHTCWTGCAECDSGREWSCVDDYAGQSQKSPITIRQHFDFLFGAKPVAGAEVTYCFLENGCTPAIPSVKTDAHGQYTVRLPVLVGGKDGGWRGVRQVESDLLVRPHVLARNIPIWTDHVESTRLLSKVFGEPYMAILDDIDGVTIEGHAVMTVQVFDCNVAPAAGVTIEILGAPDVKVLYVSDFSPSKQALTGDATQATGLALVANLPIGGEYEIVGTPVEASKRVASGRVFVPNDAVTMYSLLPDPMKE